MSDLQYGVSIAMVAAGTFFMLVGSIGIIRLPDFFSRTHAAGKSDTLGIMLVLGGLAMYEGFTVNSAKLLIAIVLVALANPVGMHALAKAALRYGLKPWMPEGSGDNGAKQKGGGQ
ncbi:MAG: monovalent cation/H(+) antiporter subunit G [Ignavibacteria bacterium]|nr:monovalent cation/H(+) antiporter subunit G [Ignavibacteria bacterium]